MIDEINGEIDRRKVSRLVDDGIISAEELANAPIVVVVPSCDCNANLMDDPLTRKLICPKCRQEGVNDLRLDDPEAKVKA